MECLAQLLCFMAPALDADVVPIRYWPLWNRPMSERWLASHQPVVGLSLGVLAAP